MNRAENAQSDLIAQSREQLAAADRELRSEYSDEYVAYIDDFNAATRRFTREILAHGPRWEDLQQAVDGLSEQKCIALTIDYIDALDAGIELPHDFTER